MWTAGERFAIVVVLGALASVTTVGCGRRKVQMPPAQGAGAPPPPTLPVIEKGRPGAGGESTLVAPTEGRTTGTTFPRAEAQLGPNSSGLISKILFAEGDKVRKGMVVFRQDSRDAALRVEQARAAREGARVNLRAIEVEYARTKPMFEEKAINRMQWDQLVARLDGARVGVQQADVALSMAEKALADAVVRSPIDGVVVSKLKNEGEMATTMPPTVVLVIQDQSVLELRLRLPEHALTEVKVGDTVNARFEAIGVVRTAKVIRINPAVDARTRTAEVVAEIPNPDGSLKTGLLAAVELGRRVARAGASEGGQPPPDQNAAKANARQARPQ
jgi:RND family efflux transporter MFP subunit